MVCLRETPTAADLQLCDTAEKAADYWRANIVTNPYHNPEVECLAVLMLNTRRRVIGHNLISIGTNDTILAHPREIYRPAIVMSASAIVLMHNHPSGDPTPSEADIRVTRDVMKAGQILKIELLDHVIVGRSGENQPRGYASVRELGYFYS